MKSVIQLAVPSVFAFAALAANAQTIETDYPRAVPTGPVAAKIAPIAPVMGESMYSDNATYLIQSNAEGPRVAPGYAAKHESRLTRQDVQAQAQVHVGWNAPDRRS